MKYIFNTALLLLLLFWLHFKAFGTLVPPPGIKLVPPAVEAQSFNLDYQDSLDYQGNPNIVLFLNFDFEINSAAKYNKKLPYTFCPDFLPSPNINISLHFLNHSPLSPCESESRSVVSNSLRPHELYSPWNSAGQNTGVSNLSLLQGIFPSQGSNPGDPYCRRILYQLSHREIQEYWGG